MGQGHVSCPGGIDRVKISDPPQELIAGGQPTTTATLETLPGRVNRIKRITELL
jgi:hypothetical protein